MICFRGANSAFFKIFTPTFSSIDTSKLSIASLALKREIPPPATMPSSIAAFVEFKLSSYFCFFSFSSLSDAEPTLITITPPFSFEILLSNWSLSTSSSEFYFSCSNSSILF